MPKNQTNWKFEVGHVSSRWMDTVVLPDWETENTFWATHEKGRTGNIYRDKKGVRLLVEPEHLGRRKQQVVGVKYAKRY